jgi:hypothetical protein
MINRALARSDARTHARTHALINLVSNARGLHFGKFGDNNYFKKKTIWGIIQKKSGISNKGESNIWLLLEQVAQDGTFIFYAEFDKKWYKR